MGQLFQMLKRRFGKAYHQIAALGLCALMILFTTDCSLTIGDLQYSNPKAETYTICDTPTEIGSHVTLFAVNWSTGKMVTNDNEAELRYFASLADAFYIVDRNAPAWTAQLMPEEYGLNCVNRYPILPEPTDILPLYCPAPTLQETLGKTNASGNYLGQASEVKTRCQPVRIPVCARPKSVPKNVDQWAKWDQTGHLLINGDKEFADAAKNADIIFYLDAKAPAESVYWFVKDAKELSCPGKPPPIPYKEAQDSGKLVMLTAATQMAGLLYGPAKAGTGKDSSSSGTMSASTSTTTANSSSSGGAPSASSSPTGQGPPLDFLEAVSRGIALSSAIAQGDTSGNIKDPNGSRYGIPNGKNPGGPNLIVLQAGVSLFAIVQNPIKKSRDFVNLIREGLAKGEAIIIRDPAHLSKELAEKLAESPKQKLTRENIDLAESFGESMAPSLNHSRTIMPYSRAQVFTKGWKGDFQAHHIFEQQWMEKFPQQYSKEAIDNSPAIILTNEEHKLITAKLDEAKNKLMRDLAKVDRKVPTKAELWDMYKEVYKDKPTWLEAIKGYF